MLVKLIIGAIAVVIGGFGVLTMLTHTSPTLKVDASNLTEDVKQSLNTKFGDDWDDLIDDTYGADWVKKIEAKYGKPINECILDEVTDLEILDQLEDKVENQLDLKFGDNWDDVLEKAYGYNWEQVMFEKYGHDFPNQLETEVNNVLKSNPEYKAILNQKDDLDNDWDDKYDVSDAMEHQLDLKFGDNWDDVLEKAYGYNWEQKMYEKHGADFEQQLQTEINNVLKANPEYEIILKDNDFDDKYDVSDMIENQLDLKFGDNWDDVLEKVYGYNWEQKMYEKHGADFEKQLETEVNNILKANPEYEIILKDNDFDDKYDVTDAMENQLDLKFGDNWDDVLEVAYGDNWEQKMYEKHGADFEKQLETEVNNILKANPEYEVILNDKNDLDNDFDDKYDVTDAMENQLDAKFGDDWDDVLEAKYGDNWEQKMYEKYGTNFEKHLESELNSLMPKPQTPAVAPVTNTNVETDDDHDDFDDVDTDDDFNDIDDDQDDLDDDNDDDSDDDDDNELDD